MPAKVPRTRNTGQWTEARYRQFINTALRRASMRWGPINQARRNANVKRGYYKCSECKEIVTASVKDDKGKRKNNVFVDHITPVVDPVKGFVSWDDFIGKLFCELDNLQVLCTDCHNKKTEEERIIRKKNAK